MYAALNYYVHCLYDVAALCLMPYALCLMPYTGLASSALMSTVSVSASECSLIRASASFAAPARIRLVSSSLD